MNPLEVNPGISGRLPGYEHVLPRRPGWFPCACCPPNLVRLITSLEKYVWDEKKGTVFFHLFVGGTAVLEQATIRVESAYPWEGHIKFVIQKRERDVFTLAVRLPAKDVAVRINGECVPEEKRKVTYGYLYLENHWKEGDAVTLDFSMPVRRIYCNPLVRANESCVALQRGPLVYCFEGADNGENLQQLCIPREAEFQTTIIDEGPLAGVRAVTLTGIRRTFSQDELYAQARPCESPALLCAVPYYAWGNRGENQMRVWMPEI